MRKSLSAAILTAVAFATVTLLPVAPAQAQSAACGRAIEEINAAVAAAGARLTPEVGAELSAKLFAIDAVGPDRATIETYALALVDEDLSLDMTDTTDAFNAACTH
ncbi:hypothetical protein D5S18_15425 [Nocardia panacis]|uniref:DUF732 domain-containing protein n=1 Tax=Nocardia panacis TaxID=2340916 RepID=A0A3A4JWD6_9NOCA|nr:hypothetical protein [Nocardia panacis]RJO74829.1 hypothetical protein D5S18_15425 [Nocardia panacis]